MLPSDPELAMSHNRGKRNGLPQVKTSTPSQIYSPLCDCLASEEEVMRPREMGSRVGRASPEGDPDAKGKTVAGRIRTSSALTTRPRLPADGRLLPAILKAGHLAAPGRPAPAWTRRDAEMRRGEGGSLCGSRVCGHARPLSLGCGGHPAAKGIGRRGWDSGKTVRARSPLPRHRRPRVRGVTAERAVVPAASDVQVPVALGARWEDSELLASAVGARH